MSDNDQQVQDAPTYVQRIVRHIRGIMILLGSLTALVVAIIGFWDQLDELICDKVGYCLGEAASTEPVEPPPPAPPECDPDDIETCL